MPDGSDNTQVSVLESIGQIDPAVWDGLSGGNNPLLSHAFFSALEQSGSACSQTGWQPLHIALKNHDGVIMGVAPVYLRGDSHGEYVFDFNWADAYQRAGGNYYPKLLMAVPFSPVTGPRLLCGGDDNIEIKKQLGTGLLELARKTGVSSIHANFLQGNDATVLDGLGFIPRLGLQYHWNNNDYQCFDDFLAELTSRKRKAIRRERKSVAKNGVSIVRLSGEAIKPAHWDAMFGFYTDTGSRKWGRPYLNRDFFTRIGKTLSEKVMLIMAYRGDEPIAGALNLIGGDALYGRYWGCSEDVPFLHFEICYHQAIEAAIELGLARVEAGAQGEHKISRGYVPVLTRSAHWISDPGFRDAIADFTKREAKAVMHEKTLLDGESPYRMAR